MAKTAKQIKEDTDYLWGQSGVWRSTWQDISSYCLPRKSYITRERTSGQKVDPDIYDTTAISAAQILAAGLQAFLTNPTQKWFALALQNRDLMDDKTVKEWLSESEEKIRNTLNGSNFNNEIFETYLDLGVVGTASLFEEEDEKDIIRFATRPVEEGLIVENSRGVIDTMYRKYKLTVKKAFDQWGNSAGKNVIEAMKGNKFEDKITFVHYIAPRGARDITKRDGLNMPFVSKFINYDEESDIKEGGFHEFPFYVPRFYKVSREKHGYSPGISSFPDILMINKMSETIIVAAQKVVDPPLLLPDDGYIMPFRTTPGGLNYKNAGLDPRDKAEPLRTEANIGIGLEMENQRREVINHAFFADLFLMLARAKGQMTATEIVERSEEKMLLLAPVLGRLMNELLDPLITRTFAILLRNGIIAPPPASIRDQDFVIEYVSVLARAQKLAESRSLDNFLNRVGSLTAIDAQVVDKVKADKVVDELSSIEGVSSILIRDEKEVALIRKQRAEQQAQIAQMAALSEAANIAKTGSEAAKNLEAK